MECNCGGDAKYTTSQVKTLDVAREWYPEAVLNDLPILVRRCVCSDCGRQEILKMFHGKRAKTP